MTNFYKIANYQVAKYSLTIFFLLSFTLISFSQVSITALNVNVCGGASPIPLGNIVLTEIQNNDFPTTSGVETFVLEPVNGNLILSGTPRLFITGSDIDVAGSSVSLSSNVLTISVNVTSTSAINSIAISGLSVYLSRSIISPLQIVCTNDNLPMNGITTLISSFATVSPSTLPPVVINNSSCLKQSIKQLSATGTNLKWYSDPFLFIQTATGATFTPSLSTSSSSVTNYYVTQRVSGCESAPATVTYSVKDTLTGGITGYDLETCRNFDIYTITGIPPGGTFATAPYLSPITGMPHKAVFTPKSVTGGFGVFTYNVTSSGCVSKFINLTIMRDSTVLIPTSFSPNNGATFSTTDPPANLGYSGIPNSQFSGPGVSQNKFYPAIPGINASPGFKINFLAQNNFGCVSRSSLNFIVTNPSNKFSGYNSVYCQGDEKALITITSSGIPAEKVGALAPGTPQSSPLLSTFNTYESLTWGTITGNVMDPTTILGGNPSAYFNPSIAGSQTLSFSVIKRVPLVNYTPQQTNKFGQIIAPESYDWNGTSYSVSTPTYFSPTILVYSNQAPTFTLPANVCNNSTVFNMNPVPSGGTWAISPNTVTGVITGNTFNPTAAGAPLAGVISSKLYTITYTSATSVGGCNNYASHSIIVNDSAVSNTQVSPIFLTTTSTFIAGNQILANLPLRHCKDINSPNFFWIGSSVLPQANSGITTKLLGDGVKQFPNGSTRYFPNQIKAGKDTITYEYYNLSGCRSRSLHVIDIDSAAFVNAGVTSSICAGTTFPGTGYFTGTYGGVSSAFTAASNATWSSGTGGLITMGTVTNGGANFNYVPSPADTLAGFVNLTLTSTNPTGACNATIAIKRIDIKPNAKPNAGSSTQTCGSSSIFLNGNFGLNINPSQSYWLSITGTSFTNIDEFSAKPRFNPSLSDQTTGAFYTLTMVSQANSFPICGNRYSTTQAQIDQAISLSFTSPNTGFSASGKSISVCAGSNATVNGIILGGRLGGTPTPISSGLWITSGTGTFLTSGTSTTTALSTIYVPSSADTLAGKVLLRFTTDKFISSICPSVTDTIALRFNYNANVNAGANRQVCGDQPVFLAGTFGGDFVANSSSWLTIFGTNFSPDASTLNARFYADPAFLINGGLHTLTLMARPSSFPICPSRQSTMTVRLDQKVQLDFGLNSPHYSASTRTLELCAGGNVPLTATISGGLIGGTSSSSVASGLWKSSGTGIFTTSGTNTTTSLNTVYIPSAADSLSGKVVLKLTSDFNSGSTCSRAKDSVNVIFHKNLNIILTNNNKVYCSGNGIVLDALISSGGTFLNPDNNFKAATWSIVSTTATSNGFIQNPGFTSSVKPTLTYLPSTDETRDGATIRFKVKTPTPLVCPFDSMFHTVYISKASNLVLPKRDTAYCADPAVIIKLKAAISGSATSATWTTTALGTLIPATFTALGIQTSQYTPTLAERVSGKILKFYIQTPVPIENPPGSPPALPGAFNVCPFVKDSMTITLNALPIVKMTLDSSKFCNSLGAKYRVRVNPSVGTSGLVASKFNENWMVQDDFLPNLAFPTLTTGGSVNITYSYTNALGCFKDTSTTVAIDPLPVANFSPSSLCSGDYIIFFGKKDLLNTTLSGVFNPNFALDSIKAYSWSFGEKSFPLSSTLQAPQVVYSLQGSKTVTLDVRSFRGCASSISKNFTISPYPIVDFDFGGHCFSDTSFFIDKSTIAQGFVVDRWAWNFGNGDSLNLGSGVVPSLQSHLGKTLGTFQNPSKIYGNSALYNVKLTAQTGSSSCKKTITKTFYILPTITPSPQAPYRYETKNGKQGFVISPKSEFSSWKFGPASKTFVKSADSIWYMGNASTSGDSSYSRKEQSYIECPCFNLKKMTKPMVKIGLKYQMQNAGAVLQSSFDGGFTWSNIGSADTLKGLNWYNKKNINGNPGKIEFNRTGDGWTDTTKLSAPWISARIGIDNLIRQDTTKNVRFRIAFGSSNSNKVPANIDGFAFNSFAIEDRNRSVLVEQFVNSSETSPVFGSESKKQSEIIFAAADRLNKKNIDLIPLFYHTNFPGFDTLNRTNVTDNSARVLYYGVSQVPRNVINGKVFTSFDLNALYRSSLEDASFTINITKNITGNNLSANVSVKSNMIFDSLVTLQVVAVERSINLSSPAANGQLNFQWVMRKLMPDAAGAVFNRKWAKGDEEIVTRNWAMTNIGNSTQIGVLAFVQDVSKRTIYQVAYSGPGVPLVPSPSVPPSSNTSLKDLDGSEVMVSLIPNPSDLQTMVVFSKNISKEVSWALYDQTGSVVLEGKTFENQDGFVLSTEKLASGIYLLKLSSKNETAKILKLAVSH